jgi:hypothetical protein
LSGAARKAEQHRLLSWSQGLVKLRPIPSPTGGLLLEDSLATDVAQGFSLGRSVLVVGLGDAGIADKQRTPFSSRLRFVADHHPKSFLLH